MIDAPNLICTSLFSPMVNFYVYIYMSKTNNVINKENNVKFTPFLIKVKQDNILKVCIAKSVSFASTLLQRIMYPDNALSLSLYFPGVQ